MTISDEEFNKLAFFIHQRCGIKLGKEKKTLVMGRLRSYLLKNQIASFSDYYDYVVSDKTGQAEKHLVSLITTNHTYFMREVDHFDYFKEVVLPDLAATVRSKDLRIWSAGCSTGNEPLTLAMIIDEYFGVNKSKWDTKLLATDISDKALTIARGGSYTEEEIAPLPARWRQAYFAKTSNDSCRIQECIKNEVIFRRLNLMDAVFPFKKKFHVIFCRNVMIYFDKKTRNELVKKFYDLTEDNGYLFVGHSESLDRTVTRYKYVKPAIYRKEKV